MHHPALLDKLNDWRESTILVVGDFMLDQMVFGDADRLSPEAPVPVLRVKRTECRPGGAGHLCLALAALRARVHAFGVTGHDSDADALLTALEEAGVNAEGLISDPSRPTTTKQRIVGLAQHRHPQMMFRVDRESREPLADAQRDAIFAALEAALPAADAVCIEDYDKGVCSPGLCARVIEAARARNIPVLVDPAAISDYSRYRGATAITPNRTEVRLAASRLRPALANTVADDAGPHEHAPLAAAIIEDLGISGVVVTLDRHGALLVRQGHAPLHVPTVARQVYDVTGAGDVVIAALAASIANNLDWPEAVALANAAAGLEVERFGAVPIPFDLVVADIARRHNPGAAKIKTADALAAELDARGAAGPAANGSGSRRGVVFTNGCFDILHAGHLSLLRRAAQLGDYLVVAINSDESVRRLKGPERPINTQHDRAELLGGLECVDAVVVFDDDTPERIIRRLRPDVLVKGAEYSIDQIPGADFVVSTGGRIERLPMVEGKSTTGTVARIRAT